jgi:hypothetical protein
MALEEGCAVTFRVVLRLVPRLFYVSWLKTKNVPHVLRLCAGARIGAGADPFRARQIEIPCAHPDVEHVEHVEHKLLPIT